MNIATGARLVLLAAACGPRAQQPPVAPLPPSMVEATPATSTGLEPGEPPTSSPIGEPIAIAIAAPAVGDAWQRVSYDDDVIETVWAGDAHPKRHQETGRKFDYRASVLEVAGDHPSKLSVSVALAQEILDLDDQHQEERLLRGGYAVATGGAPDHFGHGGVVAERSDGQPLNDREREELETLFTLVLSGSDPLPRVLATSPLRLHETRVLDPEQTRALIGDLPTSVKLSLALIAVDLDHHRATLQLDVTARDTANDMTVDTSAREVRVYDTTLGMLVNSRSVTRRVEHLGDMTTTTTARGTREQVRLH